MKTIYIRLQPLTREAFAPYGDVIETDGAKHFDINKGTIERFHDLARVDIGGDSEGRALVSIARCNEATSLPAIVPYVERHPLGSQACFPLSTTPLVTVVAEAGESVDPSQLVGFLSNGRQGINYRPGVWHMPLIAFEVGEQMLIVDRGGPGHNCDELYFDDVEVTLHK